MVIFHSYVNLPEGNRWHNSRISENIVTGWWYTLPLWKIWVRQLRLLFPIHGKRTCSKPPTRVKYWYDLRHASKMASKFQSMLNLQPFTNHSPTIHQPHPSLPHRLPFGFPHYEGIHGRHDGGWPRDDAQENGLKKNGPAQNVYSGDIWVYNGLEWTYFMISIVEWVKLD